MVVCNSQNNKNIEDEQKKWKYLEKITIKEALNLINQKTDKEISAVIGISKTEIRDMVINFKIKEHRTLVSEIKGGSKLTQREMEFFAQIKQGKNIAEIADSFWVSRARVTTVAIIIIAKIFIGLYNMPDRQKMF